MDRILLRVDEAAQRLGFSKSSVYKLISAGEIPAVKVGKSIRLSVPQLEVWASRLAQRNTSKLCKPRILKVARKASK